MRYCHANCKIAGAKRTWFWSTMNQRQSLRKKGHLFVDGIRGLPRHEVFTTLFFVVKSGPLGRFTGAFSEFGITTSKLSRLNRKAAGAVVYGW